MRQLKITKQTTSHDNLSMNIYLQEIGKIELLKADEEFELAHRISEGDQDAFEVLVNANLRFVVSVSKKYQNQGLSLSDLINEGNLGLIEAAKRFDRSRGFKFISYAVWWIRQSILQAIAENSRMVRLPVNKIGLKNKVSKAYSHLSHELLREPTIDEVARSLDLQFEIVEDVMNISNLHTSLDAPGGIEDEINLYDSIRNEDSPSPDMYLNEDSIRKEINRSLMILNKREAEIVRSFYGLNCFNPISLGEIALNLELSHERVRQLLHASINKLKSQYHSKSELIEYIRN